MKGAIKIKNLKLLREEKGLSQQKLADEIGTNQQSIHRYEHGYYEPDIQTLKMLANYFDTSIDYLVGSTEERHKIEPLERHDLNHEEAELLEKYRRLPRNAQGSIMNTIDAFLDQGK